MAKLKDIKDTAPNTLLVEALEDLLEKAKVGEIRSMIWVMEWNDNCVNHNWAIDHRTSERRMIAELVMLQHNFVDNIGLREQDSVLARQFDLD